MSGKVADQQTQGHVPPDALKAEMYCEDGEWWGSIHDARWRAVGGSPDGSLEELRRVLCESASLCFSGWEHEDGAAETVLFLKGDLVPDNCDAVEFFAPTPQQSGEGKA